MSSIINYQKCFLCPRGCGVDRYRGSGYCGEGAELRLACASIHRGEEPSVTGNGGSGTIFVSGCNLGCVFCQNYQISHPVSMGRAVSTGEFACICMALQKEGAENINIVTGSHAIPALASGIDAARIAGLSIPVLWNTSAYETPEALELLRGRVDAFLPDLKTLDSDIAGRFFNAPDYPAAAAASILKMMELAAGSAAGSFAAGGSAAGGESAGNVIIRHLILPGYLESSRRVLRWFADNAKGRAQLSLMTQYTPPAERNTAAFTGRAAAAGLPSRYVNEYEYDTVLRWLDEFGIDDGYCQELVTGSEWLPDFSRFNPFSSELSKPVWHWKQSVTSFSETPAAGCRPAM